MSSQFQTALNFYYKKWVQRQHIQEIDKKLVRKSIKSCETKEKRYIERESDRKNWLKTKKHQYKKVNKTEFQVVLPYSNEYLTKTQLINKNPNLGLNSNFNHFNF